MRAINYPYMMLFRFADDYETTVGGNDEGDCIWKADKMRETHGDIIYYTGICDEDYADGEYVGRENFIYE